MAITPTDASDNPGIGTPGKPRQPQKPQEPLRLWPGVVIVVLQWLGRFALPLFMPDATPYGVMGGLAGGLAIVIWWMFFSRAPWSERLSAVGLMIGALFAASRFLHVSMATGAMGMLFYIYAVPTLSLAFVAWALASRRLADGPRRAAMIATILISCGVWALVQTGGFTGSVDSDLAWRWTKTPEERLLAEADDEPLEPTETMEISVSEITWPGFRGPHRNSIVPGVHIETDWSSSPPVELWRRAIGPGWSSFAVHDDLFYTQEQRGEDEVVSCYKVSTGEPLWRHRDAARFWESNGGAGPRGTPTLRNGQVYTLGATGILNVLDAADGRVVWTRNAATETGTQVPMWGFASSPLVLDDLVIVATAGTLVAYDLDSGEPLWFGPDGGDGYSSPHLLKLDGEAQVVQVGSTGLIGVAPADGTVLWEHPWKGYPIVQPALTADGDVLISVSDQSGLRRLAIKPAAGGWKVDERWTSLRLKPYYSDFVVHAGHAFGFDGSILTAIDLDDGGRKWKGGRYGPGQVLLLADQSLLLVLSEKGELALVEANPDQFTEVARFKAIQGKTWNHPVLAGDVLLVRNGQEMAAFRLALATS
jgi:outer membrane protein assembly factor BamB